MDSCFWVHYIIHDITLKYKSLVFILFFCYSIPTLREAMDGKIFSLNVRRIS